MIEGPFAKFAPVYREKGYRPRPITPGTKACKIKDWQRADNALPPGALNRWDKLYGDHGIGLLLGSPFPDGTVLGALDIDRDEYTRVARLLLNDPVCGRIGSRGILFFVRVRGSTRYREFKVKPDGGGPATKVGELLIANRLAVIPPTIHPNTSQPYHWVGSPLHEVDFSDLPLWEISE